MSFKVFATLFIIALACNTFVKAAAPEEEEGVLVLTDDNFEETVKANEYILIEFYAPWCGHCKSLAPEYAKAAQKLKGEVALAKVDATVHKSQSEKYGVQGFPTLKFFINGEAMEYGGGRTESEIVNWLRKKTQPSTKEVSSVEEVEKLQADNEVVVVYFGEQGADFEAFEKVTKTYDDLVFAHTFSADLKTHFKVGGGNNVVLFKNFDEKRNDCDCEISSDSLKTFIDANSFPTIMEFNQKAAQRIFGENLSALFILQNSNAASTSARTAFDGVAQKLKGKIVLSWSQIEDGIGKRLGDFLGVKDEELPLVYIVKPQEGDVKKFRMEGDISEEAIQKFFEDYEAGSLKTKLKSDEIPESNDEPVKVIVGKQFEQIVLDETKDVLVEFYAPWCGHCKSLAPKYDELAKMLLVNPNLVIAKMDSTTNEVDQVSVSGFPTIKFFPANNKADPIDFNGNRDVEGFLSFLKEKSTFPWVEVSSESSGEAKEEAKEDL